MDSSLETDECCADTKQARADAEAILNPRRCAVQARAELSEAAAQSLMRQQVRDDAMKARADAVHVGSCPQDEAATEAPGHSQKLPNALAVGEQDEAETEAAMTLALSAIQKASTTRKLLRSSSEKSMSPQIQSVADMQQLYANGTCSSFSSSSAPDRRAVGAQPPDTSPSLHVEPPATVGAPGMRRETNWRETFTDVENELDVDEERPTTSTSMERTAFMSTLSEAETNKVTAQTQAEASSAQAAASTSPSQCKHCDKSIPPGRGHFCDALTETDLLNEAAEQELNETAAEQDYETAAAAAAVSLLSEHIGAQEAALMVHAEEMVRAEEASPLSDVETIARSTHNSDHSPRMTVAARIIHNRSVGVNDSGSHSPRSFVSSLSPGPLGLALNSPCAERSPKLNEHSQSKATHDLIGDLRTELSEAQIQCSQLTYENDQNKRTIAQLQLQQLVHDEAQRVQEELVSALKTELLEGHDEAQRVQAGLKTELLEGHDEAQRVQAELMLMLEKEQERNRSLGEPAGEKDSSLSCLGVDTAASLHNVQQQLDQLNAREKALQQQQQLLSARERALQQQQHALNGREWEVKEIEAEAFTGDEVLQQQVEQADRVLQYQVEQASVTESAAEEKIEMLESLVSQLQVELQVEAERWMRAAMDAGAATEEMKSIATNRDELVDLLRSQEQKTELLQATLTDQVSKMQGEAGKVKQTGEDICRQAALLNDKQQDYNQVRKELDSIEGVVRALEQVVQTKSSMMTHGEEELKSARVEITYLTAELQKTTKPDQVVSQELERSVEDLKSTNLRLESCLALSREQCVILETEVRELTESKREDRAKVARLQEAVHSVQRMTAKGSIEELKTQLSLVQGEAGILKDENRSYQNRLSDGASRHVSQISDIKAELSIWKAKHQSMVEYIKSFSELNLDTAPTPAAPRACGSDSAEIGVLQAKLAFFQEKLGEGEHEQLQMTKACQLAADKIAELAAQAAKGKLEIVHLQGCIHKSNGVSEGAQNDTCLDCQQLSMKLEQAEKKLVDQEEASVEKREAEAGALRSLVQCLKWIQLLGSTSHKLLRRLHMDISGMVLMRTEAFGSSIQRVEHQLPLDGPSPGTSRTGMLQAECVEGHELVKAIVLAANESHSPGHRAHEEPITSNRSHEAHEHMHRVSDWTLAQQHHHGGYSARGGYLTARESIEQGRRLETATRPRATATSPTTADMRPLTTREYIAQTQFDGLPRRADPRDSYTTVHRAAQSTTPRATVAVDATGDGRADYLVSGVDRNNDGIPDALQDNHSISLSSRISPRDTLRATPDTAHSLVSTPADYLVSTPPIHMQMGGLVRGLGGEGGLIPKLDFSKLRN